MGQFSKCTVAIDNAHTVSQRAQDCGSVQSDWYPLSAEKNQFACITYSSRDTYTYLKLV